MINNAEIAHNIINFNNELNIIIMNLNNSNESTEREAQYKQLCSYIKHANTRYQTDILQAYLPWLLTSLLQQDSIDIASLNTLILLRNAGLNLNIDFNLLGKKVSLLTFISQFKHESAIKFAVETLNLKIKTDEAIHPITVACMYKQEANMEYLISKCSVYSQYSPLAMAATYQNKILLKRFVECKTYDQQGLLPIHHAIAHHDIACVQQVLNDHPDLVKSIDLRGRSLVLHAVMAGELSLLMTLHEKYNLPLNTKDNKGFGILGYCVVYDQSTIVRRLDALSPVSTLPLLLAITKHKSNMIDWCLSHRLFNINNIYEQQSTVAHLLCRQAQVVHIVKHDLFRKSPNLFFAKNANGLTPVDEFIAFHSNLDPKDVTPQSLEFMRYVISCLHEIKQRPSISTFDLFGEMIDFCLHHNLIKNEECFGEGLPLFQLWESHFHQKHNEMIARLTQLKSTNNEQEIAQSAIEYYQKNIQLFETKYKTSLNAKDTNGAHLFANLIKLSLNGSNRILWLAHHVSSLKITNLDEKGSSLLHLACQHQHMDIIRWCCEIRHMSSLKQRAHDTTNALDLSLQSGNKIIIRYLVEQLTDKEYEAYDALLTPLGLNRIKLADNLEEKPAQAVIINAPLNTAKQPTNSCQQAASEIIPELDITYDLLLNAFSTSNLRIIKELKQEKYKTKLLEVIDARVLQLIQASGYKYSVLYQMLRIDAVQLLLTSHWPKLIEDVISTGEARVLWLILNQPQLLSQLDRLGWHILTYALTIEKQPMMLLLLQHEKFAALAHQQDNYLLFNAASLGLTQIVFKLLELPEVRANADLRSAQNTHIINNPLKAACNADDLESCEALLKIPCVISSLAHNDYALIKEVINNNDDNEYNDFLSMLCQLPDVHDFIKRTYPNYMLNETDITVTRTIVAEAEPIYFYNPDYYLGITTHDFFDAVISGNAERLTQLFFTSHNLHPQLIRHLASCAVTHGQWYVLQQLFDLALPCFNSHLSFCNLLLTQAIRSKRPEMVQALLSQNPFMGQSVHLFDNRLLRCAVAENSMSCIHLLLTFQSVSININAMDNYILRKAVRNHNTPLVSLLLGHQKVLDALNVFKFKALNDAFNHGYDDIVMLLLSIPHVMHYARHQCNHRYQAYIAKYDATYPVREPNTNNFFSTPETHIDAEAASSRALHSNDLAKLT